MSKCCKEVEWLITKPFDEPLMRVILRIWKGKHARVKAKRTLQRRSEGCRTSPTHCMRVGYAPRYDFTEELSILKDLHPCDPIDISGVVADGLASGLRADVETLSDGQQVTLHIPIRQAFFLPIAVISLNDCLIFKSKNHQRL